MSRFPVQHPQYQYPPSKNPYWTKIQGIKGRVFSDQETEHQPGQWRSQFDEHFLALNCELHVEIGCNAGHVIVEWAKSDPQKAYIGMDWKFKPIFRGVEKGQKQNLKNLIFLRAHAERLNYIFGPQEIDSLYLFFPDPWPKKAQQKNRFITPENLKQIAQVIKPKGVFHIKTDHPDYFEWMMKAVESTSDTWKILDLNRDLHKNHPSPQALKIPEVTLFEKLFIQDQIPIQSLKLMRLDFSPNPIPLG